MKFIKILASILVLIVGVFLAKFSLLFSYSANLQIKNSLILNQNREPNIHYAAYSSFYDTLNYFYDLITNRNEEAKLVIYDLSKLENNVPTNKSKSSGDFTYKGKLYSSKIKIRGDHYYHWLFKDKAYRIKLKNEKFNGNDNFNLIYPKSSVLINNHFAYRTAKKIGVLAPESEIITARVNNNFGVYELVEQINFSFLNKNGVSEGSELYYGDNISDDRFIGVEKFIFRNPGLWDKKYPKDKNNNTLIMLIEKIKKNDFSSISIKEFAKFSALLTLLQSYHFTNHNFKIVIENNIVRPILWDPLGLNQGWSQHNRSDIINNNHFWGKLLSDDVFRIERQISFNLILENKNNIYNLLDDIIFDTSHKLHQALYSRNSFGEYFTSEERINEVKLAKIRLEENFNLIEDSFNTFNIQNVKLKLDKNYLKVITSSKIPFSLIVHLKNKLANQTTFCNYSCTLVDERKVKLDTTFLSGIEILDNSSNDMIRLSSKYVEREYSLEFNKIENIESVEIVPLNNATEKTKIQISA